MSVSRFTSGNRSALVLEVDGLEQVLHHCAHLAELTTQTFLQRVRRRRIRLVDRDLVDQKLST